MFFPLVSLFGLGATLTLTSAAPLLGARDNKITFTSTLPTEIKGGEDLVVSWQGGASGKYTFEHIEEYDEGTKILLHTVLDAAEENTHSVHFAPKKCWQADTTFRFVVYDSEGIQAPEDRAYSDKMTLVAGDHEDDPCEAPSSAE